MAIVKILSDLNISGVVTSDSFKKTGGTSSEFLKADGSVDDTTYLTGDYMPVKTSTPYIIIPSGGWSVYNLGSGTMAQSGSSGKPSGATQGYWFNMGRRDSGSGYVGMYINDYQDAGKGAWIGRGSVGTNDPTWERIYTDKTTVPINTPYGFSSDSNGNAKTYIWTGVNTAAASGWRKIGRFTAGVTAPNITITINGGYGYGVGSVDGSTATFTGVQTNGSRLEGSWWSNGDQHGVSEIQTVYISGQTSDIYVNLGPYVESTFTATISQGTFVPEFTVATPSSGVVMPKQWGVNDAIYVNTSNNVNIGIKSPDKNFRLDVFGNSADVMRIASNGFANLDIYSSRTSGNLGGIRFAASGLANIMGEFNGLHGGGFDWKVGDGIAAATSKMSLSTDGELTVMGNQQFRGTEMQGNFKTMLRYGDAWLRINEDGEFTSGSYFGSTVVRTDGELQVGGDGTAFIVKNSSKRVGINQTNPSYNLDVNGDGRFTGVINSNRYIKILESGTTAGRAGGMGYSETEDLEYTGNDSTLRYLNHYGFGIHKPLGSSSVGGRGAYMAGYFGVDIFTSGISRIHVEQGGDVGIGDTSPSYKLDVNGTIRATGDVIAYSDIRVKENVKTIDSALDKVTKLRGVEFNKIGETTKSIGVIAQEIEEVLPEVVKTDEEGMKAVAYGNITGVLIEAIKELKAEIEELKKQIK